MPRSSYGVARTVITILASTAMSVVVAPVVGEFFIGIAKEHHIYELPYKWPGAAMSWLSAMAELPWLREAAIFLAGLTIGMWFDTFARRRAGRAKSVFTPRGGEISINDIEFNASRLSQPSPWLELYLTSFNAAGYETRPLRVTGRVTVSGQEFHGHIELIDIFKTHTNGQFFRTGLKIPVSASEAQHCLDCIQRGDLSLEFSGASVTFGVTIYNSPGPSPELWVQLPKRVGFNTESLRTEPYLASLPIYGY